MNKQEFLEKWGYTPIEGYGGALFDFREHLGKDLDELIRTDSSDIIPFAVYLTGHDETTIIQMYHDWKHDLILNDMLMNIPEGGKLSDVLIINMEDKMEDIVSSIEDHMAKQNPKKPMI